MSVWPGHQRILISQDVRWYFLLSKHFSWDPDLKITGYKCLQLQRRWYRMPISSACKEEGKNQTLIYYLSLGYKRKKNAFVTEKLLKESYPPWLVWLSGFSVGLQTKGLPVWFPVRAHAWVAGQVPNKGHIRGNHTLMFLSLSFPSLPFSKIIK